MPSRIIKGSVELIALIVLLPLAVILGMLLWRSPAVSPIASVGPSVTPSTSLLQGSIAPTVTPVTSTVTLTIKSTSGETSYAVPVARRTAVIDVMHVATEQGLTMETTDYGGSLGLFIHTLNGVANDPAVEMYWHLYVNDELSPLGASNAYVTSGDVIRWEYKKMHDEK